MDNGDDIILNQGRTRQETLATQLFDENYAVLSEKEFAQGYPGQAVERT